MTDNLRDFGGDVLRRHGVSVVTPPQVIGRLLESEPSGVALATRAMAARKKRPPMTSPDVIAAVLRQQGSRTIGRALRAVVH